MKLINHLIKRNLPRIIAGRGPISVVRGIRALAWLSSKLDTDEYRRFELTPPAKKPSDKRYFAKNHARKTA